MPRVFQAQFPFNPLTVKDEYLAAFDSTINKLPTMRELFS